MKKWLILSIAILAEVSASLALKGALTSPALYAVVVGGFAAATALLSAGLRAGLKIGVTYGIWGATGVALTAVLSLAIFGEPITPVMAAGIALVMVGVLVVELGSQRANRAAGARS